MTLLMAAGCGPTPSFVYVDERVAARALAGEDDEPALPRTPPAPPPVLSEAIDLPGSPPRSIGFKDFAERNALVRNTIEANRREAIAALAARLRDAYHLEIKRAEAEARLALRGERSLEYDLAIVRVLSAFERWADRRAPLICGIALTAGFPDPDASSSRSLDPDATRRQRMDFERARQYRELLRAVDQEYFGQRDEILATVEDRFAQKLLALTAQTIEAFQQADERAAEEARDQILSGAADAEIQLVSATVDRPAEEPIAVDVPSVAFPRSWEPLSAETPSAQDDLGALLKVWAATNGYKPTTDPKKGRDATEEFIAWVKQRQSGR